MESLLSVINSLNLPKNIKKNIEIYYKIRKNWEEILGDKAKKAFPLYVEMGTLYIALQDHYELQNFYSNYLTILQSINALLKKEGIILSLERLKFFYISKGGVSKKIDRIKEDINLEKFSDEAWASVEKSLSMVADTDLRECFRGLLKYYRKVWG